MPIPAGLFPAAQQRGFRNIYEFCAKHFPAKGGPVGRRKMLSFNNLRVL
jgi:hypothetical protein